MMSQPDPYTEAHLVVAAIRLLEHQHNRPPSIEEACECLSFSLERGNRICRKLADLDVLSIIEGAYGTRLTIENHLGLEDIPRGEPGDRLGDELKKFQENRKQINEKVASIQAEQADKKKTLFAELDKKLKDGVDKKS